MVMYTYSNPGRGLAECGKKSLNLLLLVLNSDIAEIVTKSGADEC